mgnify:CR=1 FL=1
MKRAWILTNVLLSLGLVAYWGYVRIYENRWIGDLPSTCAPLSLKLGLTEGKVEDTELNITPHTLIMALTDQWKELLSRLTAISATLDSV